MDKKVAGRLVFITERQSVYASAWRGADFGSPSVCLAASYRSYNIPPAESYLVGFRVAKVPEPSTLLLLISALACFAGFARRRPKRAT